MAAGMGWRVSAIHVVRPGRCTWDRRRNVAGVGYCGGVGEGEEGGGQAAREEGGRSASLRGHIYSPAVGIPGPMGRITGVSG